jgi:hypothetical protein
MGEEVKTDFVSIYGINVNDHTSKKSGLTYLSWSWAWQKVKELDTDATFEILCDNHMELPWFTSPIVGYFVKVKTTIFNKTLTTCLPVLDGANKAMKDEPYTYEVKDWNASKTSGEEVMKTKNVDAINSFEINNAHMRCLVKCIAKNCGLGLYIYNGESAPPAEPVVPVEQTITEDRLTAVTKGLTSIKDRKELADYWETLGKLNELTDEVKALFGERGSEIKKSITEGESE